MLSRPKPRRQGFIASTTATRCRPNAAKILDKLNGALFPTSSSFLDAITNPAKGARAAPRMAGAPGLEIWDPYAIAEAVREAITSRQGPRPGSGRGPRLRHHTLASGIPSPLPSSTPRQD